MSHKQTIILAISLFVSCFAFAQDSTYCVLDSTKAQRFEKQCSRAEPQINGGWNPSESDIDTLQKHLSEICKLKSEECCSVGGSVTAPFEYRRQYVGIITHGRKMIYVNAFPLHEKLLGLCNWRKEPYLVCDGGESYWGVVFDPETKKFLSLAFNGVG
jgi:hypothetical protein